MLFLSLKVGVSSPAPRAAEIVDRITPGLWLLIWVLLSFLLILLTHSSETFGISLRMHPFRQIFSSLYVNCFSSFSKPEEWESVDVDRTLFCSSVGSSFTTGYGSSGSNSFFFFFFCYFFLRFFAFVFDSSYFSRIKDYSSLMKFFLWSFRWTLSSSIFFSSGKDKSILRNSKNLS